jgi:hypothetical protein
MVLVGLVTLAVYALALLTVERLPGIDIASPLAIWWTGAWLLGGVFGVWNLWDSALDARDAYRRRKSKRIRAGGIWRLRSDALQCSACVMMVAAGLLAILQLGSPDIRTGLILTGGLAVICNQAWNRIDRERVIRMPSSSVEARAMTRLATEIAADARQMGHDVANTIMQPVAVLEMLRNRPGTFPADVEDIDEAIDALISLTEHVHTLHQHVKERDPSYEKPPEIPHG